MASSVRSTGFSLVELMVVIAIIGILALLTIPRLDPAFDRAKEAMVKSNVHTTQLAAEDWAVTNNGLYPPSVASFRSALPDTTGFVNPFTDTRELPMDGAANAMGKIGYEQTAADAYRVTGWGRNGLIVVVTNGR
jgi:prepilin-type N-terminal cleavage/methylation domain-containing protein